MTRVERNTLVLMIATLTIICILTVTAAFSGETPPKRKFKMSKIATIEDVDYLYGRVDEIVGLQ